MLLHTPFRLVQAILNRVPNAGKAFQVGRVKAKETWIVRCLNHELVFQIEHNPASITVLLVDPAGFNESKKGARRNFLRTMIIDANQFIVARLGIIPN